jgi:hypothetical protein
MKAGMARKPNYGMERRQRERVRQDKAQERQRQREAESAGRKAGKADDAPADDARKDGEPPSSE